MQDLKSTQYKKSEMPIKPEDIKLEEPLKEGESPMKQQKQFLAVG
jgi:hypothetical protein